MAYAENTAVPVERSKAEIERMLSRYGADQFMSAWSSQQALIGFTAHKRMVRFTLPLPTPEQFRYHVVRGRKKARTDAEVRTAIDRETRRRWRSLVLAIKAKLEAVASKISSFEDEFLPWIVLPSGRTVGQEVLPQIDELYEAGGDGAIKLLPPAGGT
jgi:hypothetical protein